MPYLSLLCRSLLLCSLASNAGAQDFLWSTASARSQAMGGVYLPSSRGAIDALTTNPAGLTALSSRVLDLSLSSFITRGSFTNSVNTNSALRNPPGFVPYGAFGMPIGASRFSLGIGLVPEITSASKWSYTDATGVAGASYASQKQRSSILAARAIVGVGFAVTKSVSIGASMGAVYNANVLEAPYTFQSNPKLAGLKTLLRLHTSGFGWNSSIGITAHPTNRLQLNAAWRSKTTVESTGDADGNLNRQFAALGIVAPVDFHYAAAARTVLPQSVTAGASMRIDGRWILAFQGDFVNWKQAFSRLPVSLTNGNNSAVNGLLGSTSLYDVVPIEWKNQFSIHGGVERLITENVSVQAGFAHANNPVPASTLSPLTAAILQNRISSGVTYRRERWNYNLAYAICPTASAHVTESALKSGEYSNSTVRIGIQSITFGTSLQF